MHRRSGRGDALSGGATIWLGRCVARAALALLLVAAGAAGAQGRPRMAVLPVVVHSSEDPGYLRAGLSDMIASRLDQSGGVEVVRVEDVALATTSLDVAVARGRELGADYVLFGSFTRFGDGASLDMQCVATRENPDREPLREIFVHSGSIGEVIPDLQDLAGKIARFASDGSGEPAPEPPAPEPADAPDVSAVSVGIPAPAPGVPDETVSELKSRIEVLEEAVARLEEQVGF